MKYSDERRKAAMTKLAPRQNRTVKEVAEEVLLWLRPMIDDLPEMYAVPLGMADVDGRSQQELTDVLGLSLSGAKSRIQRARVLPGESLRRC